MLDVVEHAAPAMRGQRHLIEVQQGVVQARRLGIEYIQTSAAQLARNQGRVQRSLVHLLAARGVDEQRAVFHARDEAGVDHLARLRRQRRMQADDVALRQQCFKRDAARVQGALYGALGAHRIAVDDPRIEAAQTPGQHAADIAKADQADGLAADLVTGLAHRGVGPLALAHHTVDIGQAPIDAEHQCDGQFGHRRRIAASRDA